MKIRSTTVAPSLLLALLTVLSCVLLFVSIPTASTPTAPPPAWYRPEVKKPDQPSKPSVNLAAIQFKSIEAYVTAGNPDPLSHRFGEPRYDRKVANSTKLEVKERDGGCLVFGLTANLEVDHRRALMNNGDNSMENLGTLCESCHKNKYWLDWSIQET